MNLITEPYHAQDARWPRSCHHILARFDDNTLGKADREDRTMRSDVLRAGEGRTVWVVGDRYTIKAAGEDTGGAYALIEARVPPPAQVEGGGARSRADWENRNAARFDDIP